MYGNNEGTQHWHSGGYKGNRATDAALKLLIVLLKRSGINTFDDINQAVKMSEEK